MTKRIEKNSKEIIGRDSSNFLYVGVGASAGGLDAIEKLLSNIPENSGMAFIIVQHMDPTHKSGLVNILIPLYYHESSTGRRWSSSKARPCLYNSSQQRYEYSQRKTPVNGTPRTTWP